MANSFTINMNSTLIRVIYKGPLETPPDDYLYAVRGDHGWEAYDDEDVRVEGLLADSIVAECEKIHSDNFIYEKNVRHYFELKEYEDE